MDVCAGGTINKGASSITFTNDHPVACNITSCSLPGFPTIPPNVVVPAKVGSRPGTKPVQLNPPPTVAGDYPYSPDCCDKETNPVIKVQ
jgi:hypothetical protein